MLLQELTGVKSFKDTTAAKIIKSLKDKHGIKVTTGAFGLVLNHPSWDHVVKFFPDDACYMKFVNLAIDKPNPSFPVFKRKPVKMTTFFKVASPEKSTTKNFYVVKIEKLKPLNSAWNDTFAAVVLSLFMVRQWRDWKKLSKEEQLERINDHFAKNIKQGIEAEKILNFIQAVDACQEFLSSDGGCHLDLHDKNVMVRDDGNLVIIDPFSVSDDENPTYINHVISGFDLHGIVDQDFSKTVDSMAKALG